MEQQETRVLTELFFVHGWGCDSTVWRKWLPAINKNISYQILDRGYFGNGNKIVLTPKENTKRVMVSHSFGLHLAPAELLQTLDLLVLISSFRYFHEQNFNGRMSQKSIQLMKHHLEKDPIALLQNFYTKCGLGDTKDSAFSNMAQHLILDDLLRLDKNQIDLNPLKQIPQIILLHGAADQIVDAKHSHFLHEELKNSKLFINDKAEHALPITQWQWCMRTINENQNIVNETIFCDTSAPIAYDSIASNFGRRAASYDKAAYAQKYAANHLASRISKQTSFAPGSILEIGCGTGLLSEHLLSQFPNRKIHFLDPAEDMLTSCRDTLTKSADSQFIHSTIEQYVISPQFSQTKYALIASSFVLHWLFDFKLVLNRLLDQLAPAGQLFFAFPIAGSFPPWRSVCANLNIPFTANQLPGLEDIKSAVDSSRAHMDYEEYLCDVHFENALNFFQHLKMLGANTKKFIPSRQLTISDFRLLLQSWDKHQAEPLGKSQNKITCSYKILEGTITRR